MDSDITSDDGTPTDAPMVAHTHTSDGAHIRAQTYTHAHTKKCGLGKVISFGSYE